MASRSTHAPKLRPPTIADFVTSLKLGAQDVLAAPLAATFFASVFVGAGLLMTFVTYWTGQTFWLVLAVLGFPLVGTLSTVGFYDVSRRLSEGKAIQLRDVIRFVWSLRKGQLPWLATIIVVIFLFWFFLGHMIFALFLGLSPITHISTSFDVFFSIQGAMMLCFGTIVGAFFAALVFALSVHGIPMLVERDIDFMTAALSSISAVASHLPHYLAWGAFIGLMTLISMLPLFSGLLVSIPIFGHASWHLYQMLLDEGG